MLSKERHQTVTGPAFVEQSVDDDRRSFDRISVRDRVVSAPDDGEGYLSDATRGVQQSDVVTG